MNYKQIPSSYKDDTIAEAMYGRELEYFHYEFDATNFKHLLLTAPAGSYRDNLQERLDSTLTQMANVDAIYEALKLQITSPQAHESAVIRAAEKRVAEKLKD